MIIRFLLVIILNLHVAPMLLSRMRYMIKHRDSIPLEKRYKLGRFVMKVLMRPGKIKTISTGTENLPKEDGYVMFPNHQGKYDIIGIVLTHDRPCTYVMDKDRSYFIMIREILDLLGGKRMKLNDVRQNLQVINEMAEEVAAGTTYIIFSEGGYNRINGNKVHEFKPGSFKAATKVKAPIVPVCLIDSYVPFNSYYIKPCTTQVHYLEPIYYDEYKDLKGPELSEMVRSRIMDKMRELGVNPD